MGAGKHGFVTVQVAQSQGNVFLSGVRFFKAVHIKHPERGRQPAGLDVTNSHSVSSWFSQSGRAF
jgi:hypothetical protein